jgi:hypothetical protein
MAFTTATHYLKHYHSNHLPSNRPQAKLQLELASQQSLANLAIFVVFSTTPTSTVTAARRKTLGSFNEKIY